MAVKKIFEVNGTDESASAFYVDALVAAGYDRDAIESETIAGLSFVEIVSATRTWHGAWQNGDERRAERIAEKNARDEIAKAKRLAALAGKRDALVAAAKRDAERAAKRDAALAELREAGLLD